MDENEIHCKLGSWKEKTANVMHLPLSFVNTQMAETRRGK